MRKDTLIGLITYSNSKYLDMNGNHKEFENLKAIMTENRYSYVTVRKSKNYNKQKQDQLNQLKNDYIEIFRFNKNLYKTIFNKSYSKFNRNLIRRIAGIYLEYFLSLVKLFYYNITNLTYNISKLINRQMSITSSHIDLMKNAVRFSYKWLVILEDDIHIREDEQMENNITNVIGIMKRNKNLIAVNISASFGLETLGMGKIEKRTFEATRELAQRVIVSEIPNTDTLCATIYRVSTLPLILKKILSKKNSVSVPIDIKLNMVFKDLIDDLLIDSYCYGTLEYGIFEQMSLKK